MKIGYLRDPITPISVTTYFHQDGYSTLFYLGYMHTRHLRMMLIHRKAILTLCDSIFAFFVTAARFRRFLSSVLHKNSIIALV